MHTCTPKYCGVRSSDTRLNQVTMRNPTAGHVRIQNDPPTPTVEKESLQKIHPTCKKYCDHPASLNHTFWVASDFLRRLNIRSSYYTLFDGQQPSGADLTYVGSLEDMKQQM
ncbi:hypothetical protein TNCV_4598561 [Trichonephila clavipes]|nr:hypothetical protein TNCV_4598561 [Trichonephila clavipes]